MVEIRYGGQYEINDMAGLTVGEVREQYRKEFGIPDKAKAKLNGAKVKNSAEMDTVLNDDDKLTFAVSKGKGAYMVGALLLALSISGSIFAYGFVNASNTLSVTSGGGDFASVTANTNVPTWTTYGNFKTSIGDGSLFDITPTAGYPGDLVVTVSISNADELVQVYRVLSLKLMLYDASDNTTIIDINEDGNNDAGDFALLTLGNGAVDMFPSGGQNMVVNVKSGFYISHIQAGWGGSPTPEVFCEVAQR